MTDQHLNLKSMVIGFGATLIIAGFLFIFFRSRNRYSNNASVPATADVIGSEVANEKIVVETDFPHYKIFKGFFFAKMPVQNKSYVMDNPANIPSEDIELINSYIDDVAEILSAINYRCIFIDKSYSYKCRTSINDYRVKSFDIEHADEESAKRAIPYILDQCIKNQTLISTYSDIQRIIVLNLSGIRPSRLSPVLKLFRELVGMIITGCEIKNALNEIKCVKKLMWIFAESNSITEIPALHELGYLQFISLIWNDITSIDIEWLESKKDINIYVYPKSKDGFSQSVNNLIVKYPDRLFVRELCVPNNCIVKYIEKELKLFEGERMRGGNREL